MSYIRLVIFIFNSNKNSERPNFITKAENNTGFRMVNRANITLLAFLTDFLDIQRDERLVMILQIPSYHFLPLPLPLPLLLLDVSPFPKYLPVLVFLYDL